MLVLLSFLGFQVEMRTWQSQEDSFLETGHSERRGDREKKSTFADFLLSKFYSTQACSIGDGATHVKDESSQALVFSENILTQDMFRVVLH